MGEADDTRMSNQTTGCDHDWITDPMSGIRVCAHCRQDQPETSDVLPSPLVDRVAQAVRDEIVRQYRDDERGKCSAGSAFYEEHIAPNQIARVAVAQVLAWINWR